MTSNIQNTKFDPNIVKNRDIWVFDLDNTLYPSECDLFAQIDVRMTSYLANLLETDPISARVIQKQYLKDYGTTLKGLIENHQIDPHDFLNYVHDIDFAPVERDERLRIAIDALPGRKIVYTNGDKPYAEKVMARLGIENSFEGIHDIVAADLIPKPRVDAFDQFMVEYDIDPNRAVMFEDMVRNLIPAYNAGMGTVWINTGCEWGKMDHSVEVVHAEITNLSPWLHELSTHIA